MRSSSLPPVARARIVCRGFLLRNLMGSSFPVVAGVALVLLLPRQGGPDLVLRMLSIDLVGEGEDDALD